MLLAVAREHGNETSTKATHNCQEHWHSGPTVKVISDDELDRPYDGT